MYVYVCTYKIRTCAHRMVAKIWKLASGLLCIRELERAGICQSFGIFAAAYLRNPFFWVMTLHQWTIAQCIAEESVSARQNICCLLSASPARFTVHNLSSAVLSRAIKTDIDVSMRNEFTSLRLCRRCIRIWIWRRKEGNHETCSGHTQIYVQRIARVTRTSARTMQKTMPLMDFQSRTAKRRGFPDVSENSVVAIFRVNKDAGIVVRLVSLWKYWRAAVGSMQFRLVNPGLQPVARSVYNKSIHWIRKLNTSNPQKLKGRQ